MVTLVTNGLFELGQVLITPGIRDRVDQIAMLQALSRHSRGDWGDLDEHDWKANDAALEHGFRLLSAYRDGEVRFWIITEHDRSTTTILLPEED
jgi:hypothetical protein